MTELLSHFGIRNVAVHVGHYMQVSAPETQKSIYSQTNPSPPPSPCIQTDIWPVISPSVEETCGHLMTPTGVMRAIAQDGAMTVSFNISLYILCEMRGTLGSTTLFTGHCRSSGEEHTCSVSWLNMWLILNIYTAYQKNSFICGTLFTPGFLLIWWLMCGKCLLLCRWLWNISFHGRAVNMMLKLWLQTRPMRDFTP